MEWQTNLSRQNCEIILPQLDSSFRFGSPHNHHVADEMIHQIQSRHGDTYNKKNIKCARFFVQCQRRHDMAKSSVDLANNRQ